MATAMREDARMSTKLTYDEIAAKYGKSPSLVRNVWCKHPAWPSASEVKRGRALQFDAAAVDAVVREHFLPAQAALSGGADDLLTLRESYDAAVEHAEATGRKAPTWDTVRAYDSRGQWCPSAGTRDGVRYFRRGTLAEFLNTRRMA